MAASDKLSYRVFSAIRDDYVAPFLTANGFVLARKGEYEQLRDDTINRITIDGRTDRRADYCMVEVDLSVIYRQAGELFTKHLGNKKAGLARATARVQFSRVSWSKLAWDVGLDHPEDWRNLLPEKDPNLLGPMLVEELRKNALPFFAGRQNMSVVLDPSKLKPDREDYERDHFLKPACLWLTGEKDLAIHLLKAREAELDDDYRIKGLLMCGKYLEQVQSFREFLESSGA